MVPIHNVCVCGRAACVFSVLMQVPVKTCASQTYGEVETAGSHSPPRRQLKQVDCMFAVHARQERTETHTHTHTHTQSDLGDRRWKHSLCCVSRGVAVNKSYKANSGGEENTNARLLRS